MKLINTDTAKATVTRNSYKVQLSKVIKGLEIGDWVIVSDDTKYGDVGIDNWPSRIYPTVKTMQADSAALPNHTWVSNLEDKALYYSYDNEEGKGMVPVSRGYYLNGIVHRALIAQVVAMTKTKKGLTLSKKSAITNKKCIVSVDNSAAILQAFNEGAPSGLVDFSSIKGRIAVGRRIECGKLKNVTFKGGDFFSPKGAPSLSFEFVETDNLKVDGVRFTGNNRKDDYGFTQEGTGALADNGWFENPFIFVPGLLVFGSNALVTNCKMTDCFYSSSMSGRNMRFTDSLVSLSEGQYDYTDWNILFDGCDDASGAENITFQSAKMSRAFEIAKGFGYLKNVTVTNGYFAANSSAANLDGYNLTVTPGSYNNNPGLANMPLLDVNQRLDGDIWTGGNYNDITVNNLDPTTTYRGLVMYEGSENVSVRRFTFNQPGEPDAGASGQAIFAVAEGDRGLVLEDVTINAKIGSAYRVKNATGYVYIDPYHTMIGIVGSSKAVLKNVNAEFISAQESVTVQADAVKTDGFLVR